ncbi:hypothetical protein ABZ468_10755 [Streptomyces sp. NPDC005708]|uniref:hypothetical protein n=1 Tax=Streptomyces sp. NPDC005708 TaxID=3154564 RepID=UPI0033C48668
MSHTEQELRKLYHDTFSMPKGAAKFAVLEEVMRHADALGLVEFAFDVRMQATSVFQHSWVPAKAFLSYSWCLAAYDREPERFGARAEHRLLWNIKWMIYSVHQFPEVPLQRAFDLLDDMERRYRRGGHSMHAVLQHRGLVAESMGELEQAQEFYERMDRTRRDSLSDCAGCVPSSQVRTLVALGRDEEAIRIGEPARTSFCSEQPQWINSELLLPYVRTGRGEQALEAHRSAYRRIRDNPHHLAELALNLRFCVHTGNAGRGLDLIERHLPWLGQARTPLAEAEFAAAAVAVLTALENQGEGELLLRFPAAEGRRRPDTSVTALAAELRERALDIAARFDTRNGNDYQSNRIRRWMAAGPIGESVPMSVFSAGAHTPGGDRVRGLIEKVAASTAAGDAEGAARARLAAAEALLEAERPAEAVEAAEEAIRELERLGMTGDATRCQVLLARAYEQDGHRAEAVRRLRELLEKQHGDLPGSPDRPEWEATLGEWLRYGPEASRWYASAAQGFAASGRTAERLSALRRALLCNPAPASVAELLAEAESALAEPGTPVESRAGLLHACARMLHHDGRLTEAATHLATARDLLAGASAAPSAQSAQSAETAETAELLGEILTALAGVRLRLGAPDAAEEAARAALDLTTDPDDPWNEARWNAVVVLVRSLRARGARTEAEQLMADHGLDEEDLDEWDG